MTGVEKIVHRIQDEQVVGGKDKMAVLLWIKKGDRYWTLLKSPKLGWTGGTSSGAEGSKWATSVGSVGIEGRRL